MRKLGIIFAITAAATLGIAGTASAQEGTPIEGKGIKDAPGGPEACGAVDEHIEANANSSMGQSGDPGIGPMIGGVTEGAQIAAGCDAPADIVGGVCKIVTSVIDGADNITGQTQAVTDNIRNHEEYKKNCTKTTPTGGGGCTSNCDTNKKNNDGGDPDPNVLANNAGADGGLPRTGAPEVLAGLGMGLTGLGALVRRFVG